MRDATNESKRVWVRTLDVSEVEALWRDGKPSDANRKYWADTKREYESRMGGAGFGSAWFGGVRSPEALGDMFRKGWPEGADKIKKLAAQFAGSLPTPESIKRRGVWADQGDEFDRDRAYNGQLETAWRRTVRVAQRAPQVVTLGLPWCHSAFRTAEDLFWGGAAVCAAADVLEAAGYSVELVAINAVWATKRWLAMTHVTVKAAGEPLRIDAVAATCCHAASYRYYGIPSVAGVPTFVGYGWADEMLDADKAAKIAADAGMIELPTVTLPAIYSEREAVKAVERIVGKLRPVE